MRSEVAACDSERRICLYISAFIPWTRLAKDPLNSKNHPDRPPITSTYLLYSLTFAGRRPRVCRLWHALRMSSLSAHARRGGERRRVIGAHRQRGHAREVRGRRCHGLYMRRQAGVPRVKIVTERSQTRLWHPLQVPGDVFQRSGRFYQRSVQKYFSISSLHIVALHVYTL